jgi:hypothetical protein
MDPRNLNALYKYLPLSHKKTSLCANIQYLLDSQHVFSGVVCSFAHLQLSAKECTEPVFVNVEGDQESIPRIRFCQPM